MAQHDTGGNGVSQSMTRQIKNILLVEDDPDTRFMIKSTLNDCGYSVRTAADRGEAMSYLHRALYQVILMDLFMPGITAEEFVAAARTASRARIVLLTCANEAAEVCATLRLDSFIQKPLDMDNLLALLKSLEKT